MQRSYLWICNCVFVGLHLRRVPQQHSLPKLTTFYSHAIQNNSFCSSFKSFATRLFREFGCHRLLILASNFKLRGINFVQIYWARLSNPSAPALFSCRQNSERCPQYFWEIVCSDLFARLVVQKVQILVPQQPLLALSNNRSVSDSFKFFSFFSI